MELSDEKLRAYTKRLLLSRMRILCSNGFYGLLLMHMKYSIDEKVKTVCTDGVRITFGTRFLESLSDSELDFVMMHEILHVVLQHCLRSKDNNAEQFDTACDIVVNSNILKSCGMDTKKISIKGYGVSMHLTPNGKEGYNYTAEQVYDMVSVMVPEQTDEDNEKGETNSDNDSDSDSANDGEDDGDGDGEDGDTNSDSNHQRDNKKRGRPGGCWDDHSQWGTNKDGELLHDLWIKRFEDVCEAISIRDPSNTRGTLPAFAERLFKELRKPQTDWRQILNDFVQEEINDYSFSPPDRRFDDSPFFLPDFNEKDDRMEKILFMIDTSGSMSDEMITAAYSEIKGAIDQFNGKLTGWLGFFDAAIITPKPFATEEEFRVIHPAGGGGTDFGIIFEYVARHMADQLPVSIIILTDGFAPFPPQAMSMGIPVLWLINNEERTPPWGKIARIVV